MDRTLLDFAGIMTTIAFSIALAVYLDWLALRGLMRLMPATARKATAPGSTTAITERDYGPGSKAA